ncbi:MAG: ATP-binding cassette domain-containing protein, partial [Halioglobus sp.]|nr:ATP-binding cassette domain-containing protein [Halioglobus sp.]
MSAFLQVHGLARRFGGVEALAPVDLELAPGEALAITGPNGAGKSTLLACIAGEIAPSSGTVHLDGHDLSALAAHERARRGVARAFQRPALLPDRSALENVALGRLRYAEAGLAALLLGRSAAGAEHAAREAAALSALEQ